MKEVDCCTSVDGENFASDITEGCKYDADNGIPFARSLQHIEARKNRLLAESNGGFRAYDEVNAVTQ